jgi:hypothetical protein
MFGDPRDSLGTAKTRMESKHPADNELIRRIFASYYLHIGTILETTERLWLLTRVDGLKLKLEELLEKSNNITDM